MPIAVIQHDPYAGQAFLGGVVVIFVLIESHPSAQSDPFCCIQPAIGREGIPGRRAYHLGPTGQGTRVTVPRVVVPLILGGEAVPRGEAKVHHIVPWGEPRKVIATVHVGEGHAQPMGRGDVIQRHPHTGDTRLIRGIILDPVLVRVIPRQTTDAGRFGIRDEHPRISCLPLTCGKGDRAGCAGELIHIAVRGIVALVS